MKKYLILTLLIMGCLAQLTFAGNDSSIKGQLRTDIQELMKQHIANRTIKGTYKIYDPKKDTVLYLKLKKLHSGIIKKSGFYISCADFTTPDNRVIDLDFLVYKTDSGLVVNQVIVHKNGGKKRPYTLSKTRKSEYQPVKPSKGKTK